MPASSVFLTLALISISIFLPTLSNPPYWIIVQFFTILTSVFSLSSCISPAVSYPSSLPFYLLSSLFSLVFCLISLVSSHSRLITSFFSYLSPLLSPLTLHSCLLSHHLSLLFLPSFSPSCLFLSLPSPLSPLLSSSVVTTPQRTERVVTMSDFTTVLLLVFL